MINDWKLTGLTIGTIAVTVGGVGGGQLPLAVLGLGLSLGVYYFAPKQRDRQGRILGEREASVVRELQQLDSQKQQLQEWQQQLQRESRAIAEHRQQMEIDWQEFQQKLHLKSQEFEANKQSIYNQLVNHAKVQAEQYTMALFQQQWHEIQQQQALINNVLPALGEEWQRKFEEEQQRCNAIITQNVEECNQRLLDARKKVADYQQQMQMVYAQATQGMAVELHELKQPTLPPPDYIEDYPKATLVAERVLNFLYGNGVYLDFMDCLEEDEAISLLLRPKKGVKNIVEYFNTITKQLPALMALAQGCNNAPQAAIYQGLFRVDFDVTGMTANQRAAKARSKEIEELPPNWLEEIIKYSYHFRVNGQTRAGKSTFVNNLLGLMRRMFDGDVEIVLIDPKYPLSRWSLVPKYKGIEQAIIGLKAMAEEVELRLKLATEDADAGKPIRDFQPILYIIDEVDWVSSEYNDPVPVVAEFLQELELSTKKAAATLLKKGLKVGAALRVGVCYIGQSPLCSALGLNRNDFNNSCNFFLGENIIPAIDEVAYKQQQPYLKQQYKLRVERAEQYLGTPDEAKYKYFALVKAPGMSAKLVTLPPQDAYDFVPVDAETVLEADSSSSTPQPQYAENPIAWTYDASPEILVNSALKLIRGLIAEGMTNPIEICRHIWGATVNPQAKPYNGKLGVKVRIEKLIQDYNSQKK